MNPLLAGLLGPLSSLIGRLIPDPAAQAKAQLDLATMAQQGQLAELDASVRVLLADANGNLLQRSWRPLLFLTFGALIVARWFGWSAPNLQPEEYDRLWQIVELALGGGVIGRSVEKVLPQVAASIGKGKS